MSCAMVSGVVPAQPHSGVVEVMTPRVAASTSLGADPSFQVPAKALEQDQRHRAFAAAAGVTVGVVDAVGGADDLVGQFWKFLATTGHPFILVSSQNVASGARAVGQVGTEVPGQGLASYLQIGW